MMKLIKDKATGKKMYPVGKFNSFQHVFYNYNDRCYNAMVESEYDSKLCDVYDESERLLQICDCNVYDGMIYALYEDYKVMKDIIGGYVLRHS